MKSTCLKFIDEKKHVILSVDASKNVIGTVLLQEKQPVTFRSTALHKLSSSTHKLKKIY